MQMPRFGGAHELCPGPCEARLNAAVWAVLLKARDLRAAAAPADAAASPEPAPAAAPLPAAKLVWTQFASFAPLPGPALAPAPGPAADFPALPTRGLKQVAASSRWPCLPADKHARGSTHMSVHTTPVHA